MKFILRVMVCIFFLTPNTLFAWNALGHMIVADIAYHQLTPAAKKKIDNLVANLHQDYPDFTTYMQLAYWPDALRSQKIETYTHWHYINYSFSTDKTPTKNIIDTDNAEWAILNIEPIIKNSNTNSYEQARFLAFLTHIVGDLHQPLHTASNFTATHPDGDRGGNLYLVKLNGQTTNLHALWDSGAGLFDNTNDQEHAEELAARINNLYPPSYFGDKVTELDPKDWTKESFEGAKQYVYSVTENQSISPTYISGANKLTEERIALAGYRLGKLLNQLLTEK